MRPGVQIGRLFGTDIFADSTFFILLGISFFGSTSGGGSVGLVALFLLILIVSLLVHEFGHVFAVRWLLKRPSIVVLWGFGGLCIHEPARQPKHRLAISLMGPVFGFVLGGAAWAFLALAPPSDPVLRYAVSIVVWINVFWGALNLLPILPLDGGSALAAGLEWALPRRNTRRPVVYVSLLLSLAVTVAAFVFARDRPFLAILTLWIFLHNLRLLRSGV